MLIAETAINKYLNLYTLNCKTYGEAAFAASPFFF